MAKAAEPPASKHKPATDGVTTKSVPGRPISPRAGHADERRRAVPGLHPRPDRRTDPELNSSTFALAERAAGEVHELNSREPALVPLEGLARQLLRSEALASSRIEGLSISHRKLAQAALEGEQGDYKAQEVLANTRAMEEAVWIGAKTKRITPKDIAEIHAALAIVPPLDRIGGQYREEQGWIGGVSPPQADFVPAPEEHVLPLVKDLCKFANRDDISPVVQAAIAHAAVRDDPSLRRWQRPGRPLPHPRAVPPPRRCDAICTTGEPRPRRT